MQESLLSLNLCCHLFCVCLFIGLLRGLPGNTLEEGKGSKSTTWPRAASVHEYDQLHGRSWTPPRTLSLRCSFHSSEAVGKYIDFPDPCSA